MGKRDEYFRAWYAKNRKKLAEKRKARYKKDSNYREEKKRSSKRYYWLTQRRASPLRKVEIDVSQLVPDEIADVIISNDNDIRVDLVVPVPMYYHGTMSDHLKRTTQTLRLWALRGLIPESTYRNQINYRLYTQDQLLVYIGNIHLLKLKAKDFSKHPFFTAVRRGLEELEPDGIEIMSKDEWRFADGRCSWCRNGTKLEHFNGEKWIEVPCFECLNPYAIELRRQVHEAEVYGKCNFCGNEETKHMQVIKDTIVLPCGNCGRRIQNVKIV